jgi:hypothetical protein
VCSAGENPWLLTAPAESAPTDIRYGTVVAYSVGMPLPPIWQITDVRSTTYDGAARCRPDRVSAGFFDPAPSVTANPG